MPYLKLEFLGGIIVMIKKIKELKGSKELIKW
jgi:hypothetical protein